MSGPRPGSWLGEYVLEAELGRGGMGAVYLARHRTLGAARALKVLHRPSAPRALGRFEREAGHLAQVRHPNVVAVHEVGQTHGLPWLAMDRVEGAPLDEVLRRGRLPLDRTLELALGLAEGVAALHAVGVIHRDLKPQNAIVTPEGRPVVIDLGLAVAPGRDERLTRTGATVGTLRYMAPEQLRGGRELGPATDVFALGLILFELATGRPAVEAEDSAVAIAVELLERPRPAPSSRAPDLPVALDAVCARALALEPSARYADAGELAAALRALRAAPGRSRRRARARALALGAAGLALAAAATLAGVRQLGGGEPPDPAPPAGAAPPRATGEERDPEAARALAAVAALAPGQERLEAAERWRLAFPHDPGLAELARLEGEALVVVPRRVLAPPAPERLFGVAFLDAAGARAATVGEHLTVWDLERGERAFTRSLPQGAYALEVVEDGRALVLAASDRVLRVQLPEGTLEEVIPSSGVPATWYAAAVSPDGRLVAVGGRTEIVLLRWPERTPLRRLSGFTSLTRDLAFTADGGYLVSGHGDPLDRERKSYDNSARVWVVATGELFARLPAFGQVAAVEALPGATGVALGRDGPRLLLHDLASGEQVALRAPDVPPSVAGLDVAHRSTVRGLACARAAGRLVSVSHERTDGTTDSELRVWELASGRELFHALDRPRGLQAVDVTPDGRFVLAGTRDGWLELWDLRAIE